MDVVKEHMQRVGVTDVAKCANNAVRVYKSNLSSLGQSEAQTWFPCLFFYSCLNLMSARDTFLYIVMSDTSNTTASKDHRNKIASFRQPINQGAAEKANIKYIYCMYLN